MASSNWPGLIDELREGFLAKNLSQMTFPAPDPSLIVQEFADLWADKQGVSVFVETLVFQYRHERQRIFEIENQGLRSTVRLSRESLDDLSFWMDCLKNRGEEEWVRGPHSALLPKPGVPRRILGVSRLKSVPRHTNFGRSYPKVHLGTPFSEISAERAPWPTTPSMIPTWECDQAMLV